MGFYFCEPCGKAFNGIRPYKDHLASAKHKKKVSQQEPPLTLADSPNFILGLAHQLSDSSITPRGRNFWCSLCDLELNGSDQVQSHVKGSKHLKMKMYLPANSKKGTETPKIDLSNMTLGSNPKDVVDSYSDFKFSFNGVSIENVLKDIKVFFVNDPIEF